MSEARIMSEAYDILAQADEPLTTIQLQRKLTTKISQADLDTMLNRVVFAQDGVARGYQPGSFAKTPDGRWIVKQLGMGPDAKFTTKEFIARIV